jgi:hypothetical protein
MLTGGSEEVGTNAQFGSSVVLSADGNTALISVHFDNGARGAVWVFTRSGSTWTQQGPKLTGGSEETGNVGFGDSVALSGDGNTALISAKADNHSLGAVWVFTRSGSTWAQQGPKLTGGSEETAEGGFGASVALSADGNTALIGAEGENSEGAAWVFTRSGSTWTQQGPKFTGASEGETAVVRKFGESVALSADGSTALIGGETRNGPVSAGGAAWVFTRSESTWTQQGPKFTGSGKEFNGFGGAVALSADGNTALIGAFSANKQAGAAWVFTRSGSTWTQQGPTLTGGSEEVGKGFFGTGVALSADGDTALIGGDFDNFHGAAWLFTRSGSTWTQDGPKAIGEGGRQEARFGLAVALSGEGSTALIGAPYSTAGLGFTSEGVGDAWAFERSTAPAPEVAKVAPKSGPTTGGTTVKITGSNLAEASAVRFGSVEATSFTVNSPSSITAVSPEEPEAKVDITVKTPTGGASRRTSKDTYTFAPTITALSPNTGSTAGGTSVTVTGAGFGLGTKATVFKFGTSPATSVNCASSTECTLLTPAHAAGVVTVKATVNKATSQVTKADHFTDE